MDRMTEIAFGVTGGMTGMAGAALALFLGGINELMENPTVLTSLGMNAVIFSLFALIGTVGLTIHARAGGFMMVLSGFGILISISLFGVLPALFLMGAGVAAMMKKEGVAGAEGAVIRK